MSRYQNTTTFTSEKKVEEEKHSAYNEGSLTMTL